MARENVGIVIFRERLFDRCRVYRISNSCRCATSTWSIKRNIRGVLIHRCPRNALWYIANLVASTTTPTCSRSTCWRYANSWMCALVAQAPRPKQTFWDALAIALHWRWCGLTCCNRFGNGRRSWGIALWGGEWNSNVHSTIIRSSWVSIRYNAEVRKLACEPVNPVRSLNIVKFYSSTCR